MKFSLFAILFGALLLGMTSCNAPTASTSRPSSAAPDTKTETLVLGGGCFWCTEGAYELVPGVKSVVSGYTGGRTKNPSYKEICTGETGHAEVIRIEYDPAKVSYGQLLKVFFAVAHDPTQKDRQGNDVGTQYRSAIFVQDEGQRRAAEASRAMYQQQLTRAGYGTITTEITGPPAPTFYFAEDYHQQYLDKIPNGYCPNHATGVTLPEGFEVTQLQYVD